MANATKKVASAYTPFGDNREAYPLPATDQTFYPFGMVGVNVLGYLAKYDDAASLQFVGIVGESHFRDLDGTGSAGDDTLEVLQPWVFLVAFSSVAITDEGKIAYASDDQTGALTGGTFGNPIGIIHKWKSSTAAWIRPILGGSRNIQGASRTMAATGAQSVTKFDLNKTIFLPNTAAYTLTLPAVADTQAGDRLRFIKSTTDAFAVTLDGNASETIDGAATYAAIDAFYDAAVLVSTGAAWIIESRDIA